MTNILAAAGNDGSNPLEFLTQFGIEWQLLVSQGISFAIVAVALYYFVFKPVIKVSAERQQKIEQGLKDAEEARKNLETAQQTAKSKLDEAAAEAAKVLSEARDSAKRSIAAASEEASAKAVEIRALNASQLEMDKARMKEELKSELSELVAETATKLIGRILTPEQRAALAAEAADELAKTNGKDKE